MELTTSQTEVTLQDLLSIVHSQRKNRFGYKEFSQKDIDDLKLAYELAMQAHSGQYRLSGEPFIIHPLSVAIILAELGMDCLTLQAALLHDAVEDRGITLKEIENYLGQRVALIVDGVTKLDKINFDSKEKQQAATMRKMLIAVASDWRVLVIKLADRLHNLRTISVMEPAKQRRIAQETMDIYAPLAHRLGIGEIKWQLEDLSFQILHPNRYREIKEMVEKRSSLKQSYLNEVRALLEAHLKQFRIKAEVTGRQKHLWSIYEKMILRGKAFEEIYDLVGLRVIVGSERDCWATLGAIHALWQPIVSRFKDYINTPKFNLYQSLHTTVIGPEGRHIEIQIRTWEMHFRAEYGIAAHWGYKELDKGILKQDMQWFKRISEISTETSDPVEFLELLKTDLASDEVYVFTPKGMVVALPAGSTPIDFAYAIHTDVGHRCIGAKVDSRLVPLNTVLRSGQTVEIFTSKVPSAGPSRDWLGFVASSRARSKIKQYFAKERREDAMELGREEFIKALRRYGISQKSLSSKTLDDVAKSVGCINHDGVLIQIGEGHLSALTVAGKIKALIEKQEPSVLAVPEIKPKKFSDSKGAVIVDGSADMLVKLSRCCKPLPPDLIIGYVTSGRGVSVHRADCLNATHLAQVARGRIVNVAWAENYLTKFISELEIKAFDRAGLLADISRVMSESQVNIISSQSQVRPDRIAWFKFELELADPAQINTVIRAVSHVDSVYEVYRVTPFASNNK
jgi:guanosine-3',5'-bis(diphosphate) 3'-pyrophosphohydrolase